MCSFNIPNALPQQPANFNRSARNTTLDNGIILSSDFLETSSFQGAFVSGRKTASALL
ncbi:MAG: hypothetical protein SFV81_22625 [Pirellulaceae bacterium]|nr:hypothetical protein [Pirellulaceae bacterium]